MTRFPKECGVAQYVELSQERLDNGLNFLCVTPTRPIANVFRKNRRETKKSWLNHKRAQEDFNIIILKHETLRIAECGRHYYRITEHDNMVIRSLREYNKISQSEAHLPKHVTKIRLAYPISRLWNHQLTCSSCQTTGQDVIIDASLDFANNG